MAVFILATVLIKKSFAFLKIKALYYSGQCVQSLVENYQFNINDYFEVETQSKKK
jgi:hypothetical protein